MSNTAICERCGDLGVLTERALCPDCDELDRPERERQAALQNQWQWIHGIACGFAAMPVMRGESSGLCLTLGGLMTLGLSFVNVSFLFLERRWVGRKHIVLGLLAPFVPTLIALAGIGFRRLF